MQVQKRTLHLYVVFYKSTVTVVVGATCWEIWPIYNGGVADDKKVSIMTVIKILEAKITTKKEKKIEMVYNGGK